MQTENLNKDRGLQVALDDNLIVDSFNSVVDSYQQRSGLLEAKKRQLYEAYKQYGSIADELPYLKALALELNNAAGK